MPQVNVVFESCFRVMASVGVLSKMYGEHILAPLIQVVELAVSKTRVVFNLRKQDNWDYIDGLHKSKVV